MSAHGRQIRKGPGAGGAAANSPGQARSAQLGASGKQTESPGGATEKMRLNSAPFDTDCVLGRIWPAYMNGFTPREAIIVFFDQT